MKVFASVFWPFFSLFRVQWLPAKLFSRAFCAVLLSQRWFLFGSAGVIFFMCAAYFWPTHIRQTEKVLRLYSWAHYVPQSVIRGFEQKEKVRVVYDVFDTTETLEAKLLAARSGYDVVFAPSVPTAGLFIPAGAFSALDHRLLPNMKFLNPAITRHLKRVDASLNYIVPYLWGTTGILYHKKLLHQKCGPGVIPLNSWQALFHPRYAACLSPWKIVLLDSPSDVFPDVLLLMSGHLKSFSVPDLEKAACILAKIQPFVYRFSSDVIQDLMAERVGIAETFSTYAQMVIRHFQKMRGSSPYVYVLPKEGAQIWVDVMAIPKDAPNKRMAHRFLNYLMSPKVIAQVTNHVYAANAVLGSKKWMRPEILKNKTIYPGAENMKRLHMDPVPPRIYERKRLRYWTAVKAGLFTGSAYGKSCS